MVRVSLTMKQGASMLSKCREPAHYTSESLVLDFFIHGGDTVLNLQEWALVDRVHTYGLTALLARLNFRWNCVRKANVSLGYESKYQIGCHDKLHFSSSKSNSPTVLVLQ